MRWNIKHLLIKNVQGLKEAGFPENAYQCTVGYSKRNFGSLAEVYTKVNAMVEERKIVNNMD